MGRANESIPIKKIDWDGKLALIEAAKIAEIEHFIFCSLMNKTEHLQIPLMRMKKGIEIKLINSKNKVFSLGGPKGWLSTEIIALCEKYIGQPAKIVKIPVFILKLTQKFIGFFEFGQNIADRL